MIRKRCLLIFTEVTDSNNRLIGKGVGINTYLNIDWTSLIEFKKTFTEGYSSKTEKHLVKMGIDTYHGRAHFENQNTIVVGEDKLKGEYIFLATGAKPRKLNIPGEESITTSERLMETKKAF